MSITTTATSDVATAAQTILDELDAAGIRSNSAVVSNRAHSNEGMRAFLRSAGPRDAEDAVTELTKIKRRAEVDAAWAAREATLTRGTDEPQDDPMEGVHREAREAAAADAAFRQTDSDRLERLIELYEQILAALQNRG